jgi:hypothetical protein
MALTRGGSITHRVRDATTTVQQHAKGRLAPLHALISPRAKRTIAHRRFVGAARRTLARDRASIARGLAQSCI